MCQSTSHFNSEPGKHRRPEKAKRLSHQTETKEAHLNKRCHPRLLNEPGQERGKHSSKDEARCTASHSASSQPLAARVSVRDRGGNRPRKASPASLRLLTGLCVLR